MLIKVTKKKTGDIILINMIQIKRVEDNKDGAFIEMMDGNGMYVAETASDILGEVETEYYDIVGMLAECLRNNI